MNKTKNLVITILGCLMLSSCQNEINHLYIFHTYSEQEIKSKLVNKEEKELYQLPTPEKEGYTFEGWYLDSKLTNKYSPDKVVDVEYNVELYAKYTINEYKINYYLSSNEIIENKYNYNDIIENFVPEKEGYTFEGWYLDSDYEQSFDYYQMPSEDLNVYAKWESIPSNDTYLVFLGEFSDIIEPIAINKNNVENVEIPSVTKIGYTFEGWYSDDKYLNKFEYEYMPAQNISAYALWIKNSEYIVSIESNIQGAFTFDGELKQIITNNNPIFSNVTIDENLGYKFSYYEIDGVKYFSKIISLDNIDKNTNIIVYADYATYELPIININTQNVEINSKVDYTDMTFSINNCENELENISGGVRLRGNSTRKKPKKPYRLKFDKKQSLFGLEKAKSWVLLADYMDPSGLHNYTAFKLASELDGLSFTPSPFKVNLYLNGSYNGLYTLCEQVQENEGRMNIEEDITEEMTNLHDFNFFICMDKSVIEDSDSILDETYFYLEEYDKYFELKYPEKENFVTEEQFNKFFSELKEYVKYILDIFVAKDINAIKKEANLSSLVDYLIIDQIMGEIDHSYKSFNMYYAHASENENEVNKLSFGPIWDYDWSLYTPWTGEPNQSYVVSERVSYSNYFFKAIAETPEFYNLVKERWTTRVSSVLDSFISDLYLVEANITESLELNHQKWYTNYDENMSVNNVNLLNRYLLKRKQLLDSLWSNK